MQKNYIIYKGILNEMIYIKVLYNTLILYIYIYAEREENIGLLFRYPEREVEREGRGIKQYFSLLDPSSTVLYELGSNRLTRDGVPVFCHVCPKQTIS